MDTAWICLGYDRPWSPGQKKDSKTSTWTASGITTRHRWVTFYLWMIVLYKGYLLSKENKEEDDQSTVRKIVSRHMQHSSSDRSVFFVVWQMLADHVFQLAAGALYLSKISLVPKITNRKRAEWLDPTLTRMFLRMERPSSWKAHLCYSTHFSLKSHTIIIRARANNNDNDNNNNNNNNNNNL